MLTKLYKLAYKLDKKGHYDEAAKIEEVMRIMSQRVGLNVQDMVSLADYFDNEGEKALADRFDAMAKQAVKKK